MKTNWLFRVGDYTTQLYGDYFLSHYISGSRNFSQPGYPKAQQSWSGNQGLKGDSQHPWESLLLGILFFSKEIVQHTSGACVSLWFCGRKSMTERERDPINTEHHLKKWMNILKYGTVAWYLSFLLDNILLTKKKKQKKKLQLQVVIWQISLDMLVQLFRILVHQNSNSLWTHTGLGLQHQPPEGLSSIPPWDRLHGLKNCCQKCHVVTGSLTPTCPSKTDSILLLCT